MATLDKNTIGNNLEVLWTGVLDIGAVTAPSVGSATQLSTSAQTTITSGSGFILIASLQFAGETKVYPLPFFETMSSGGDGGEISWLANIYASLEAPIGYVTVYVNLYNYLSTLYLPASKATLYILRVAASPAE